MSEGKRISLQGFGTFKLGHRAARKGRNPQSKLVCVRVVLICMCFIASADIVYF